MTDPRIVPTRTKARKRALDILFEADLRQTDPAETLADHVARAEPPVRPFTIALVEGVRAHWTEIDELVASCLRSGWTMERMPRVDRVLARLATFELLHTDTEPEVAVNDAVTLASQLSTDDSPAFVNGVLGAVLDKVRAARPASADAIADPAPDATTDATADPATDATTDGVAEPETDDLADAGVPARDAQ